MLLQHNQTTPAPWNVRDLLQSTGTPFAVADYRRHAVIFSQGGACDSVMHIEKGRVRLAVTTPSGRQAICGLVETGGFMGEEALAGHAVRRQTATAVTATQVLVVAKAHMILLLHTQHAISDRFIAHVLARNVRLEDDLTDQLLSSSEQRLARTLLVLAARDEQRPSRWVLPDVSQEVIAEMVGTTRSHVNSFMSKFKKLGFIEEDGGVLQVNPGLLHIVHDGGGGVSNRTSSAMSQAVRCEQRR